MQIAISAIYLRTVDTRSYGQYVEVVGVLVTGEQRVLIREFGALPDVVISHYVTAEGVINVPALDHRGPK